MTAEENGLDKTRTFSIPTHGAVISHYKIIDKIGSCGMGVVYKAEDSKLKRVVALKFLREQIGSDDMAKAQFFRETRAAPALNHPNIITIYEIVEVEGRCFISMEFIAGKSLKRLINKKALSVKKALNIAIQAADGLKSAHEKGIIHRDLKSDNIMLTPEGIYLLRQ